MDVTLRPATRDDIPDLSRLHMLGAHGLVEAVYQDALPGLPTNEIFERVLALTGTRNSFENASIAMKEDRVIGEVHAYPFDDTGTNRTNPYVPKDRLILFEPYKRLDPLAAGTYHINILAVYPEFSGKGVGTILMSLARSHAKQRGFSNLSLLVFDNNRAVDLYQRLGFVVTGRSPLIHVSGHLLAMACPI